MYKEVHKDKSMALVPAHEGSQIGPRVEAATPTAIELMQQMTTTIADAFKIHSKKARDSGSLAIIKDFYQMNLPTFQEELDPLVAENWYEKIVKAFDALKVTDDATQILLATYQLRGVVELCGNQS